MMRRAGLYVAAGLLFVSGFAAGTLTKSTSAQDKPRNGLKLLVFGIGVKDYAQSQNFYEKIMGLPVAFKFTSPDGKRTTTYYQVGRDSFLEMQPVVENAEPGLTHVHLLTDDLPAEVARLRQAGLASAARNATTPSTVTEIGVAEPSHVKNANVFDPNGIRLELNELLPDSLTKKAMDSWK